MKNRFFACVVGSGIAGLNSALRLAKYGKVLVITKKGLFDGATSLAQGGIAAVQLKQDSIERHIKDTMKAGAFHNDKKSVEFMVKRGLEALKRLESLGVKFEKSLHREGGHSFPRIAHKSDETGQAIMRALVSAVKKEKNIEIRENTLAIDLLVKNGICYGISVLYPDKTIEQIFCSVVVLAAGGIGQIYEYTTNPKVATADGIAMAARAGAKLKDLEFVQFHPTAFKGRRDPLFLLSESLRGEGAILVNKKSERFCNELAARDAVSRKIFEKMKKGSVFLTMRNFSEGSRRNIPKRFPAIYAYLKKHGYDLTKDQIPVTPAAHYICGGVKVNLKSETSIKNLYAVGEVACTGVHGANRLASNSLLEAVVFSEQFRPTSYLARHMRAHGASAQQGEQSGFASCEPKRALLTNKFKDFFEIQKRLKHLMWDFVGIIRTPHGLRRALREIQSLENLLPPKNYVNESIIETRNMLKVAQKIAAAALHRPKSLGCHFIL